MTATPAPLMEKTAQNEVNHFGLNLDAIRFKLSEKSFHHKNNEKCHDQDLIARYPERYGADHGDFHMEVQFADQAVEDTLDITPDHAEKINARLWVYSQDKKSAFCYIMAADGNWYIRTSEQAPRVENGINYWKLGEASLANNSDIEELKGHFNSVANKQKPA